MAKKDDFLGYALYCPKTGLYLARNAGLCSLSPLAIHNTGYMDKVYFWSTRKLALAAIKKNKLGKLRVVPLTKSMIADAKCKHSMAKIKNSINAIKEKIIKLNQELEAKEEELHNLKELLRLSELENAI